MRILGRRDTRAFENADGQDPAVRQHLCGHGSGCVEQVCDLAHIGAVLNRHHGTRNLTALSVDLATPACQNPTECCQGPHKQGPHKQYCSDPSVYGRRDKPNTPFLQIHLQYEHKGRASQQVV